MRSQNQEWRLEHEERLKADHDFENWVAEMESLTDEERKKLGDHSPTKAKSSPNIKNKGLI